MRRYIIQRLLRWIPSVLIILLLIYALVFFGAGDPIKLIFLRSPGDVAYDETRIEAIRESAGLNRPFLVQFGEYIGNILQGNFGNSLVSGRSVNSMIKAALPVTLQIGLSAIFLLSLIGILLEIKNRLPDIVQGLNPAGTDLVIFVILNSSFENNI